MDGDQADMDEEEPDFYAEVPLPGWTRYLKIKNIKKITHSLLIAMIAQNILRYFHCKEKITRDFWKLLICFNLKLFVITVNYFDLSWEDMSIQLLKISCDWFKNFVSTLETLLRQTVLRYR